MNFLKFILLLLAIALLCFSVFIAISTFGNPMTLIAVNGAAEDYLSEKYPGREFNLESAAYDYKLSNYYVNVSDPELVDCHFSLYYDSEGVFHSDTYKDRYLSGFNTAARIDNAYRSLTKGVFESEAFNHNVSIAYGLVEFSDREDEGNSVPYSSLTLDGDFTTKEFGMAAGAIVVYIVTEDVSAEAMARTLLDIRAVFDAAEVPFKTMDLTLTEEELRSYRGTTLVSFLYTDIREDGLMDRVSAAIEEARIYDETVDEEMMPE